MLLKPRYCAYNIFYNICIFVSLGWCFVEFDDKEGVIPSCCLDIKSISGNDIEHVSLMRATPGKFLTNVKYKGTKEDEMSYPKGAEVDVIDTKTSSPGYWLIK